MGSGWLEDGPEIAPRCLQPAPVRLKMGSAWPEDGRLRARSHQRYVSKKALICLQPAPAYLKTGSGWLKDGLKIALRCLRPTPVYPQMGSGRCVPEVARSGRVKQLGRVGLNGGSYIRPAAAVARSAWESAPDVLTSGRAYYQMTDCTTVRTASYCAYALLWALPTTRFRSTHALVHDK